MQISFSVFHFCYAVASAAAAAVYLYHTVSFRRCGSHGAAVAVRLGLLFVTATNGTSACVRIY